ncbi:MAG: rplW [Candidatus Saccharibacteria bacterium]|nr:rplW [Candidatus Saccharibacteria bacterium]
MTAAISVIPRATEKAYAQSQNNTYVFNVPLTANKQQVVAAVETQFNVKVTAIKTLVQSGKAVRFSRGKNRYPGTTTRKDAKKAYVTLAKGDSIQVFDQPTAEEEKK